MSGLILNNIYSVRKSTKTSLLLASIAVIILVLTKETFALRAALFLPFLLIPVQAFEVLKQDAMSGWNRFEITLPVTRQQIVGSKYITFILLFIISLLLIITIFLATHIFLYPVIDLLVFNFILRGMGIILLLAASTYPLTYKLGTEKSDIITIGSMGFTFAIFFGLSILLEIKLGSVPNIDEFFSIIFIIIAIILFIISYVVSVFIYTKKEF